MSSASSRSRVLADVESSVRRRIIRDALSVAVATGGYALAFGAASSTAGFGTAKAATLSSFMFTGGSQFAAVGVLGDGGGAAAAIGAGLLLSIRSLVYGLVMAPTLKGTFAYRALASQLMIDESIAVSTAQKSLPARRMVTTGFA